MSLSKDDLKLIQTMMTETIANVVGPMFEQQTEDLGGRMDKLEDEVRELQREFRDFKSYVTSRLNALEAKVNHLEQLYTERFGYVEEDVRMLYTAIAKKYDLDLSKAS